MLFKAGYVMYMPVWVWLSILYISRAQRLFLWFSLTEVKIDRDVSTILIWFPNMIRFPKGYTSLESLETILPWIH